MNATQRNEIKKLIRNAEALRNQLEDIMLAVRDIAEQEQEKLDNMPESLQSSERAERMQETKDELEYGCDQFESALNDIQDSLDTFADICGITAND